MRTRSGRVARREWWWTAGLVGLVVIGALGVGVALGGPLGPGRARAQNDVPDCVRVHAIVRWSATAYDHWVRLESGCDRPARCSVATDVNPEPTTVEVAAGGAQEVLTFRGSPAREFTPRVQCALR